MRSLAVVLLLVAMGMTWWLFSRPAPPVREPFDLGGALGGVAEAGFARALEARQFLFPEDHGPHPEFRNEWWYYTGNLETVQGRRFGFQLVFFRNALASGDPAGESSWRSHQSWMAHFALTDVQAGAFQAFERFSRGAVGLAGARAEPFGVWLDDWEVMADAEGRWRLKAAEGELALDLLLSPQRQPVLQGDGGLSQKSAEPGNASYYYSIPRLAAEGAVRLGDQTHVVSGLAWLDREWSTSALGADQAGWDWFSLQLSDGSDLMFYRLRKKDGSADPHSGGSWVQANDALIKLGSDDVRLEPVAYWDSPKGGRYPVRWRLRVPALEAELEVKPLLEDQELDLLVRYWEGAVEVSGERNGQPITGRGYLELAGYAQ